MGLFAWKSDESGTGNGQEKKRPPCLPSLREALFSASVECALLAPWNSLLLTHSQLEKMNTLKKIPKEFLEFKKSFQ